MTLTPGLSKFVLTAHITSSVGWFGAVVAYLALALAALTSPNSQKVPGAWMAMELTGWYVIVPLAITSFLTGLVQSLGTPWGLFRHYWIVCKLLLTLLASVVLLLHLPTVRLLAGLAVDSDGASVAGLWGEVLHAGGGLLVLLLATTLAVYKPRGLTPYGWRTLHRQRPVALPSPGDLSQ